MSVISVETLVVQTLGFTVALAWSGAIDKVVKAVYTPKGLENTSEFRNAESLATAGLLYAIITTALIAAIVYIVNNIVYVTYVVGAPGTVSQHIDKHQGTLSKYGHGIDIVMAKDTA